MHIKLFFAAVFSLCFLASAPCIAAPLKASSSVPEQQDVPEVEAESDQPIYHRLNPFRKPGALRSNSDHGIFHYMNPFREQGYLRSNSHLLFSSTHSSYNFLLGVEMGYAAQRKQLHMDFTSLPVFLTDLGFPPIPNPAPPPASFDPLLSPGIPNRFFINHEETITDNGTILGVLAGWQWRCRRVMFGLEGNIDYGSYEKNRQFAFTETATPFVFHLPGGISFVSTALYQRGPIYSVSMRGGYFVTPFFFPYLRVGGQISRDEASLQSFSGEAPVLLPDFIASNRATVTGGLFGIGVEFPTLVGPSTIRVEYNYSRTESIVIDDEAFPVIGGYTFRKPNTNTLKVALVWNFI